MACELKPLSWEEFDLMHNDAWLNGWAYGPAYRELYDDYLVNWIYYVDYLDLLIKKRCKKHQRFRETDEFEIFLSNFNSSFKEDFKDQVQKDVWKTYFNKNHQPEEIQCVLKIFVGEAPPYWAGKIVIDFDKKNYFYLPNEQKKGSYYTIVQNIFKIEETKKIDLLEKLAEKGFILIAVFPFPIIQETKIRREVTGAFGEWILKNFQKQFKEYLNYVTESLEKCCDKKVSKEYAIATPLYGALQICFGETTRQIFIGCIDPSFYTSSISELQDNITEEKWTINETASAQKKNIEIIGKKKERIKFLLDINPKITGNKTNKIKALNKKFEEEYMVQIPILSTGGINLHQTKFFNSIIKNS